MRRPGPPRPDAGFTLVELLMVIAMTGIIVSAVGAALTVGLRSTDDTGVRLSETVDTQLLSAYLPQDVQNAGPAAGDVRTDSAADAGCTGAAGVNVLALRGTDADTGTAFGVTYRTRLVGAEAQLVRYACGGTSGETVIARSLATTSGAVATVPVDVREPIAFRLTTASGYSGVVTAVRRNVPAAPPPPPPPVCVVDSALIAPAEGSVLPGGVLLTPAVVTVAVSGPCGTLTADYRPDGTTQRSTTLSAGTAALQATGWSAGSRPITISNGGVRLSDIPFEVVDAAPCTVTNVRTAPSSGERSRNPSPNTLTGGAVRVSADFGPTCGAGLTLAYDPASESTSPTAASLAFPASGAVRSVDIGAGTRWSDGTHALLVKDGALTRASGAFEVTPAPCSATALVLDPSSVVADRQGGLNRAVVVTATTAGVCADLRVQFTPNATPVTVTLTPDATFSSWTATISKDAYSWTTGSKTFEVLTSSGSSFPTRRTAVLEVK